MSKIFLNGLWKDQDFPGGCTHNDNERLWDSDQDTLSQVDDGVSTYQQRTANMEQPITPDANLYVQQSQVSGTAVLQEEIRSSPLQDAGRYSPIHNKKYQLIADDEEQHLARDYGYAFRQLDTSAHVRPERSRSIAASERRDCARSAISHRSSVHEDEAPPPPHKRGRTNLDDTRTPLLPVRNLDDGNGTSNAENQEDRFLDYRWYTFVIHTSNIQGNWRENILIGNNQPTTFIADHGDHLHIAFPFAANNYNIGQTRHRILAKLVNANSAAAFAEAITTTQRIKSLRRFVLYLIRYGSERLHRTGPSSHPIDGVNNMFRRLFCANTDVVEGNSKCKTYHDEIEEVNLEVDDVKRKNLMDLLQSQIEQHDIQSVKQWERIISAKDKIQIIRDYGSQYVQYLREIIKYYNIEITKDIKRKTMAEIFAEHVAESWQEILENTDDIRKGVVWLVNLFHENNVNILEFFCWTEIIKTKRYYKINGICLQGPTNAGKSLLITGITSLLKPELIPRKRYNSAFDQLPYATAAVFEEPYITPTNARTWKLLLEGAIVKTDTKHNDIQDIARIPIYITTTSPIDNNVQQVVKDQIATRLKTFFFRRIIGQGQETATRSMRGTEYIKPPVFITPLHFAVLYTLNYEHVYAFILKGDTRLPNLYGNRLQLTDPEWQVLKNGRQSLRTLLVAQPNNQNQMPTTSPETTNSAIDEYGPHIAPMKPENHHYKHSVSGAIDDGPVTSTAAMGQHADVPMPTTSSSRPSEIRSDTDGQS